jgi:hypothetical protein
MLYNMHKSGQAWRFGMRTHSREKLLTVQQRPAVLARATLDYGSIRSPRASLYCLGRKSSHAPRWTVAVPSGDGFIPG